MIKDTLSKIESAIAKVRTIDNKDAAELVTLLTALKAELQALPQSCMDDARSIAHFTEAAAHEVSRANKSVQLKNLSIAGISYAVKGFEASHPKLVDVVNEICMALSRMGI
ncbi:MAG: DUF4404 family protein [Elusimicrobia bacterium]|nr:DUF4404 family protein [Elusimicrobiota bacterium]